MWNPFVNRATQKEATAGARPPPPHDARIVEKIREFARYAEIRQVLDRIALSQQQSKIRSVAILSEYPGEGKTLLAAALAVGYSDLARKRALVVDATTHENPSSLHLDHVLKASESGLDARDPVRQTHSVQVDLMELTDWSATTGGLPETHVPEVAAAFEARYGILFFDTTAMSAQNRRNISAIPIARRCDTSILVVSRRSLDRDGLVAIQSRLAREKIPLLGFVYNEGVGP